WTKPCSSRICNTCRSYKLFENGRNFYYPTSLKFTHQERGTAFSHIIRKLTSYLSNQHDKYIRRTNTGKNHLFTPLKKVKFPPLQNEKEHDVFSKNYNSIYMENGHLPHQEMRKKLLILQHKKSSLYLL